MFKFIAKFFPGRHSSKQSNTDDQTIKLSAQEEGPDTTNAPFFSSTGIATQFALSMDRNSHNYYYSKYFACIEDLVNVEKSYMKPAREFVFIIREDELPPKSVLAQLILDGFCLEYCDKKLYITLPTSDIESEADKHLDNLMAQMDAAKLKEEQAAAEASSQHEDDEN